MAALARLDGALNRSARVAVQHELALTINRGPAAVTQARLARLLSGQGGDRTAVRGPAAAPPVQLLKDAGAFMKSVGNSKLTLLANIEQALDMYHKIPNKIESSQARLKALRELDLVIAAAHAKLQETNGPQLVSLYRESEAEHREIVSELAKVGPKAWLTDSNLLPVDLTGMKEAEIGQVGTLWQSLLTGEGNLRIRQGEDPGFTARMQAAIAKLLQGPKGRKLLEGLGGDDRGEDLRVTLGSDFAAELSGTKANQGTGSEAIPLSRLKHGENRFELQQLGDKKLEKKDQPGEATGSFVRIVGDGAKLLGSTLTPEFITLGHELGHASRFQTGGSIPAEAWDYERVNVSDTIEQKLWHSPEEYVNVKEVENVLRAEHGIEERAYYDTNWKYNKLALVNQTKFNKAMCGLTSEELKLLDAVNWRLIVELTNEYNNPTLDWSKNENLDQKLNEITSLRPVTRVLHQLQLSGHMPQQLYDSANPATRRKLALDSDFMAGWRRFGALLEVQDAKSFVAEAPDLADRMADIVNRLTVEAAIESSERPSFTSWLGWSDMF